MNKLTGSKDLAGSFATANSQQVACFEEKKRQRRNLQQSLRLADTGYVHVSFLKLISKNIKALGNNAHPVDYPVGCVACKESE